MIPNVKEQRGEAGLLVEAEAPPGRGWTAELRDV